MDLMTAKYESNKILEEAFKELDEGFIGYSPKYNINNSINLDNPEDLPYLRNYLLDKLIDYDFKLKELARKKFFEDKIFSIENPEEFKRVVFNLDKKSNLTYLVSFYLLINSPDELTLDEIELIWSRGCSFISARPEMFFSAMISLVYYYRFDYKRELEKYIQLIKSSDSLTPEEKKIYLKKFNSFKDILFINRNTYQIISDYIELKDNLKETEKNKIMEDLEYLKNHSSTLLFYKELFCCETCLRNYLKKVLTISRKPRKVTIEYEIDSIVNEYKDLDYILCKGYNSSILKKYLKLKKG